MTRPWNNPGDDRKWVKRTGKLFDGAVRYSDIYTTWRWRKDSRAFLRKNPLCVICKEKGIITEATHSDHIIPISEGGDVWDWNNRQALCRKCHNRKTGKEIARRKKNNI